MAKITIDGRTFDVEDKLTILQAAQKLGINIPHFCYHPGLSIAGNCRICLVEVEKMPKLAIACSTRVMDGMVIHTNSEKVIKARNAVLEFILINHPLDCPICDEAGECKLQNYTYIYGPGRSRFDEEKVRKAKRVHLGPYVVFDAERCILCSRCIRFCNEVVGKPQLTFVQRGDRTTIETFPGEKLDNPYSMNVIDICPVGALTSTDFRFKERTWNMFAVESICPGCARGCNIYLWVRNNKILRITPRENMDVNKYWMCDYGRFTYKFVNSEDRIKRPMIRKDDHLVQVNWDEAIEKASSLLKEFKPDEIGVIGSAYSTNEDNYILQKFARTVLKTRNIDFIPHIKDGDEDSILIRADKTPNSTGARLVGVTPERGGLNYKEMLDSISTGRIKALYVMDDDIVLSDEIYSKLDNIKLLIVHASNMNRTVEKAHIIFPSATFAEKDGTFTNFEGRVQRINIAILTSDMEPYMLAKPRKFGEFRPNAGEINKADLAYGRLLKFGTQFDRWASNERRDARPSWKVITKVANLMGGKFNYEKVEDVFDEISRTIRAFSRISYKLIGGTGRMIRR